MLSIEEILEKYQFVQRDNLIPILQKIQTEYGYLSEEVIIKIGKYLDLPTSKIYGVASFYNQFRFNVKGKYHIKICNGSSCHINTNILIIKELEKKLGIKHNEKTKDELFSLEETACMAACGKGPVMQINDKYYTKLTFKKIAEIIDFYGSLEE
ncbi:NADH-quinone oxidoreductase subunit NuoE [Bacteroidota bacterium]